MSSSTSHPLPIAVLISGGGTTLRNLLDRIGSGELNSEVRMVVSSSSAAKGLEFAREADCPTAIVRRSQFAATEEFSRAVFDPCREAGAELIVMGGFLKHVLVPEDYQGRVINIHPSLIPAFCGHGYFGMRVHEAALNYGVKVSGCTVHFVNDEYDHGPVILQRVVDVAEDDTPETLQQRIFAAECNALPEAIELFAAGRLQIDGRRVRIQPAPQ